MDRAEGGAGTLTPPPIPLSCMPKLIRSSLALAPAPAQKFTVRALFHWIASVCTSEYNSDSVLSENQP